jgi:hypothetical protein
MMAQSCGYTVPFTAVIQALDDLVEAVGLKAA